MDRLGLGEAGLAYLAISYGLLWDELRPWMGAFALLMALFYGALAYAVVRRGREPGPSQPNGA